ncbi:MAG: helix-turn-helix transcriptional regulator [Pseudomonadota bacterium]
MQTDLSPPSMKKKGHAQEIDVAIGRRIVDIRKKYKLTQSDLASKLDVSTQQIQKYEKGENRLSLSKALDLCSFLKVSIEDFTESLYLDAVEGLSDNEQAGFEDFDGNIGVFKDTSELIKAYHSIEDEEKRRSFMKATKELARALSKT